MSVTHAPQAASLVAEYSDAAESEKPTDARGSGFYRGRGVIGRVVI